MEALAPDKKLAHFDFLKKIVLDQNHLTFHPRPMHPPWADGSPTKKAYLFVDGYPLVLGCDVFATSEANLELKKGQNFTIVSTYPT